jgi:hypothetical protein
MVYTGIKKIGLGEDVSIRINTYGAIKEMDKYYEELENFFTNKV